MNYILKMVPARARQWIYALLSAALVVWGIWEASSGEWKAFALSLAGAVTAEMALLNVTVVKAE